MANSMSSGGSCAQCMSRGNVCELSLANDPMHDFRCYECALVGEGCVIPTDDRNLLASGIRMGCPTEQPGHRKCLRCAMTNQNCTFRQGYRPYPCMSCVTAGATGCMIQPPFFNPPPSSAITYGESGLDVSIVREIDDFVQELMRPPEEVPAGSFSVYVAGSDPVQDLSGEYELHFPDHQCATNPEPASELGGMSPGSQLEQQILMSATDSYGDVAAAYAVDVLMNGVDSENPSSELHMDHPYFDFEDGTSAEMHTDAIVCTPCTGDTPGAFDNISFEY
ncbi:uncharacterized protein GGS25DRAFT_155815 [Hypoxylon fragiforme]|uniref:uncharacterized protein n=1 Tax=Hypoxylon fragiforme TaxID=63214 RepID=UPI0020C6806D|nr:uncharacterized protein GGS25DRAFT_155815 [Hypoxylon fragiforme]KAI2610633.1 hypothetical protein GGS25DRAFT_155815 [Hypoxylon fragiforme]